MRINLKKANAIQLSITEVISGINVQTVVNVAVFSKAKDKIQTENARLKESLDRVLSLNFVLYQLRKEVARVNATSGVTDLLADIARVTKEMSMFSSIANTPKHEDFSVLSQRLNRIETADSSSYGFGNQESISTSVVSEENVKEAQEKLKALKRLKDSLKEELLLKNLDTHIVLTEEQVSVLKAEGII